MDTETDAERLPDGTERHTLRFGWAAAQTRQGKTSWSEPVWYRFTSPSALWDWIEQRTRAKSVLHVWAHNWAFDAPVIKLFTELPRREWTLHNAIADFPPVILTWKKGSARIRIVDTLNIWRIPLLQIGRAYGVEKKPMPPREVSQKVWDEYAKRDVEIIRVAVLRWIDMLRQFKLGPFMCTVASQAMTTYAYKFQPSPIFIDNNRRALEIARASYLGGRTECFRMGSYTGDFFMIDVNSMYPSIMARQDFPCRLVSASHHFSIDDLHPWWDRGMFCAEVIIDTSEPIYPVRRDGIVFFPVGRFTTHLADAEFRAAAVRDHIRSIKRIAIYERAPLFREYVHTLYKLRMRATRERNFGLAQQFKLLLNALYGKFGQTGRRYEQVDTCEPDDVQTWQEYDIDDGVKTTYRSFGGIVQKLFQEPESGHSHPAISACITSAGRMLLWEAMEKAGRENVYYCDTDALILNAAGYKNIGSPGNISTLGEWAIERHAGSLVIHGVKDYQMDDVKKTKGVKRGAVWVLPDRVMQDQFRGFKGMLRDGDLNAPQVTTTIKTLKREYKMGQVTEDGMISPHELRWLSDAVSSFD